MASALTKLPIYRTVASRGYASCTAPVAGIPDYDVRTTTLPNKLVVAAAENESPITRISISVRAGARNETSDNIGAAHVLRLAAGLSTKNASQFAIIRNIQQVGANLTTSAGRETITYTLEGTRAAIEKSLPFLTDVVTQQAFKPWEVADLVGRQRLELATRPPQVQVLELLHRAAFRSGGLGNGVYSPEHRVGKISSETLQHYVADLFLTGRTAVVGLGVDHAQLLQYGQSLPLEIGEGCTAPSPYRGGGEIREERGGSVAYVAVAGEGAALRNPKEAVAFAVLQRVLAAGSHVKWSTNDNGALAKALAGKANYVANGLNAAYTETGLFGLLITAPAQEAGTVVEAAVRLLRKGQVSDGDINRAKNLLKTDWLSRVESGSCAVEEYGPQAVITGHVVGPKEIGGAVDAVTAADVQAALKKVAASKLSIASLGDLRTVPYLDEIKA